MIATRETYFIFVMGNCFLRLFNSAKVRTELCNLATDTISGKSIRDDLAALAETSVETILASTPEESQSATTPTSTTVPENHK